MAHGEAERPLETSDNKSVDRSDNLGNSSLHTKDNILAEKLDRVIELQEQILEALLNIR